MEVQVVQGDILATPADVLVSTANPWLQMTGGINLQIILQPRGEDVHAELQTYFKASGKRFIEAGSVIPTTPGSLPFQHILHAVAIDPSYDSSVQIVAQTIRNALTLAEKLGASSVSLPALATGFGPLTMADFAAALKQSLADQTLSLRQLMVVLREEADVDIVRQVLDRQT